jgi:UDPglucose--hexose-1-phosphate uridylyltransferase
VSDSSSGLRRDPLSGAWTVIAPRRGARPHDAAHHDTPAPDAASSASGATAPDAAAPDAAAVGVPAVGATAADCPFCEGHEHLTPPELDALRPAGGAPDTPGWTVRVVPNKFPVFEGGHEVVVHSPRHDVPLSAQPLAEVTDVVTMYQRRIAALCAGGAAAVTVILNHGRAAGASLAHPHSQIFATPIVPPVLTDELEQFARYQVKYGRCLLCDMMAAIVDEGSRVVFDEPLVAWTPDASRWSYELRLAPRAHQADVLGADPGVVAAAFKRALSAIAAATDDAPLNAWLHTVPCGAPQADGPPFHWHIEIAPRLTTAAGFELGTGISVDLVDPRDAAARLREGLPTSL